MAVADAHGLPIAIHARSASPAEVTLVHETLEQSLLADVPERLMLTELTTVIDLLNLSQRKGSS